MDVHCVIIEQTEVSLEHDVLDSVTLVGYCSVIDSLPVSLLFAGLLVEDYVRHPAVPSNGLVVLIVKSLLILLV